MVLGMAKQVYENKNGGNKMMLLPFIFFCDGSSLGCCCILPSKQDSIATDVTLGGLPISVKKICNRD